MKNFQAVNFNKFNIKPKIRVIIDVNFGGITMANNFGAFIKQKRQEKNLTQKQLAKELYVSESLVSKWEKGVSYPDITILPTLSAILGVNEHELITASVDNTARKEKKDARKWRALSKTWDTFFYIAYAVALLTCFITNLAVNKTLSWFFIVLSSLILAFTFTNLPKLINKNKLIFIPLIEFLALILLLAVISIYTGGTWFFIAMLSVLLGFIVVFAPIFISKYTPKRIKKFNGYLSVFIDLLVLNVLLIVINAYTIKHGFSAKWWYVKIALPIVLYVYVVLNLLMLVRFLRVNKLIKTSIILFFSLLALYIPPLLIKVDNLVVQNELEDINIFKANLGVWEVGTILERNIHLIIVLSTLAVALAFFILGIIKRIKLKKIK